MAPERYGFRRGSVVILHEMLARARMRDDQHRANEERLARRLVATRRRQRLAGRAKRRARRTSEHL